MKTVIGLISYNDLEFLKITLPRIAELPDSRVIILDNAANDEIKKFITSKFPQIKFIRHKEGNIGFSKGHNFILKSAPKSEYYFCLNTDILINRKGFEKCTEYLDKHPQTAMASAKLYHWDFEKNKKTKIIDTFGIIGNCAHSFWDKGQGKLDEGQYDTSLDNIFGISGAAFIIRRNVLNYFKIRGKGASECALFDENIFMYKDDVDLAYRLRWAGFKINMLDQVLGWHARTLGKGKKKSFFEAKMSYKNHLIMLRNNFSKKYSIQTRFLTYFYECLKFFFYLFTNAKVALELFRVFGMKKICKSEKIVKPKEVEKLLLK
ncbi:glycosyltransferase [Candidatus Peregrinibacteria bacterium]|nr:glycosyltransferase [Candidatus Peregrinibacteria bacterium]